MRPDPGLERKQSVSKQSFTHDHIEHATDDYDHDASSRLASPRAGLKPEPILSEDAVIVTEEDVSAGELKLKATKSLINDVQHI